MNPRAFTEITTLRSHCARAWDDSFLRLVRMPGSLFPLRELNGNARSLLVRTRIEFGSDMSEVLGETYCCERKVILNTVLLQAGNEVGLRETLAHELAHLVGHHIGSSGHDYVWKRLMDKAGFEPEMELPRNKIDSIIGLRALLQE